MRSNPFMPHLGLAPEDRAVVFHADDIGSSQASLAAYTQLVDYGLLSSAATMVPCPWFPATADYCRGHPAPERLDLGVHLTLTSEWDGLRWGPLSGRDPADGLLDDEGYFPRTAAALQRQARPEAVRDELVAQIERALAAGIDVTHLDSHMFTLYDPGLLPIYFELARQYRVPAFMLRPGAAVAVTGGGAARAARLDPLLRQAEQDGRPLFDHVAELSLHTSDRRLDEARRKLADCPPGLTYYLLHPATDSPELRAMAPDWRSRVADWRLFQDDAWRQVVAESGVQVIGMRRLRDAWRATM